MMLELVCVCVGLLQTNPLAYDDVGRWYLWPHSKRKVIKKKLITCLELMLVGSGFSGSLSVLAPYKVCVCRVTLGCVDSVVLTSCLSFGV